MRRLYPPIDAATTYVVDVSDGHKLYVEECGAADGQPVIFLHGGPGSGCNADHRRYFDPAHYRIILLDQRGSGRSTPTGQTRANTLHALVEDLEIVRHRLGVGPWMLFAGSWGATLALAYAQAFPVAVSAMLLRGTFLARPRDIEWFFSAHGVASIFPDAYAEFIDVVPGNERNDPVAAYHRRIHGADEQLASIWARRWRGWANHVATWTKPTDDDHPVEQQRLLAKTRIETHYAVNRYFLTGHPLLEGCMNLPDVPVTIVHGRRDLVCPYEAAWTLHSAIPDSELLLLPDAGHLASEPDMVNALVGLTERFKGTSKNCLFPR